jgi:hypothetical protein
MPKGTYWANHVLNELNSLSLLVALSSTTITSSGSGITEPEFANGYRRYIVPANSWGTPAGGTVANLNPFTFNPATALWLGGAHLTDFALLDGSGNLYYYNKIPSLFVRSWGAGDVPSFSSGVLAIIEQ